jgi:glyoxylase-like metal-dependent hydrolase (beta-lactamase superfamily II)
MSEVFLGIQWFQLPITMEQSNLAFINVYLVEGDKGYLLVDSGWNTEESFIALKKGMAKIGADVKDISQIVVTHVHPDHYGMAGRIKKLSGAIIAMHHIEKDFIRPRYIDMEQLLHLTDRMLVANGVPQAEMVRMRDATVGLEQYIVPVMPDRILHEGETITTGKFNLRVIWTPGHSSGHICLYEPDKKILFSGDHILPKITPNISVHPQSIENPLGRYLKSLQDMRQLDVALTLPGHDKPFTNLRLRIDEIIHHHEIRNQEILAAIGLDRRTAYGIAKEITWGENSRFRDLPDFHKRMAVFETLAHLEMMTAENLLHKQSVKGIFTYAQK